MKRSLWKHCTWLVPVLFAAGCRNGSQNGTSPSPSVVARPLPAVPMSPELRALAARAGAVATSADRQGVPQFLWATRGLAAPSGATPAAAARFHLGRYAAAQRLTRADVASAEIVRTADLGPGGVLVHLRQRIDGIEVYPSDVKVLMRPSLELVAISGRLRAPVASGLSSRTAFRVAPGDAVARAIGHLAGVAVPASSVSEGGAPIAGSQRFRLADHPVVRLDDEARARKIFYAAGDTVVPAYFIEFFAGPQGTRTSEAWRYLIAADDGRVLERRSLTQSDAFSYRVWADTTGDLRPLDGPQADFTPHPTPTADGTQPAFIPPVLVMMAGFNHNPLGLTDPWLATGSVQTLGNNVDAYTDGNPPDGYSNGDLRATTTAAGVFDHTYDTTLSPVASQEQAMASVTQVFYTTNWLHDWYYDSGFNEAAANAQLDNFGRGGVGGDVLHAEIQDNYSGGSRNNANMSTPSDGFSPRMQIYVWSGEETRHLTVTPPGGAELVTGSAAFGATNFNVTAEVVLAVDGTAPTSDACSALTNTVTGKIVLIDRGTCSFSSKVAAAQAAGAVAVIVADNRAGTTPPAMGGTDTTITIGAMSILQSDGNAIKASLAAGTVTATMSRQVGVERDGALDNSVVAHEWGHYLHHRLADCGANQCGGISEGWGDFNALHLMLRDGDNLDGTYAIAIYSARSLGDSGYFGLRRFPYTVDMTKNALSLKHISNGQALPTGMPQGSTGGANSEVHNTGEIWASMMWETYVALQRARGSRTFAEVRRRMSDYVVAGLSMTPPDATFTEQRDAILAAIAARDTDDLNVAAQAFARRGAGSCAIAPPRDSTDNTGVTESADIKSRIEVGAIRVDDSVRSCDQDGILDADERGHVVVTLLNGGAAALTNTTVTLSTTTQGITFPAGATAMIPSVAPLGSTDVTLDIAMDASITAAETLDLTVQIDNADACTTTETRTISRHVNVDDVPNSSATDDVEAAGTSWTRTGPEADLAWSRAEVGSGDHAWVGTDLSHASDIRLESPDLVVGSTGSLTLSFSHRFSFETDTSSMPPKFYDGGLIEITSDGGQTWADLSTLAAPGYGGALDATTGNPLGGHQAFVGKNAAWPMRDNVMLDLGTSQAGHTVRIRFRIGTDAGSGDYGWEIDNIAVGGITNTPFHSLQPDASQCHLVCEAGLTNCGDVVCTHLSTDPAHCGSCTNACAAGSVCSSGQCAVSCQASQTNCSGACVNVMTDNANCGGCGNACAAGSVCSAGQCTVSCATGRTNCAGSCVNVMTDEANCGGCGNACAAGSVCSGGQCTVTCQSGHTDCGGTCTNLMTDDSNCGTCGTACALGSTCKAGRCEAPPVARAGSGQTVQSGARVTLDASGSSDPNSDPLSFAWSQTAGPNVSMNGSTAAMSTFTAPDVREATRLTFQVAVSDNHAGVSTDHVDIMVTPRSSGDSGCSVGVSGSGAGTALPLLALAISGFASALWRRRRRRR
jgi:hypothetical protein